MCLLDDEYQIFQVHINFKVSFHYYEIEQFILINHYFVIVIERFVKSYVLCFHKIGAPNKNASVLVERKKPVHRAKPPLPVPIIPAVTMAAYLNHTGQAEAPAEDMADLILRRPPIQNEPGQIPGAGRAVAPIIQ